MALTTAEEKRLQAVEENLAKLFKLLDGAGSKNRLNRWYIVLNNQIDKLTTRTGSLESDMATTLELARKLQ